MDNFQEYIQRFEAITGIRCTYEVIKNFAALPIYIKKNFILLRVTLLDVSFIVLFSENVSAKIAGQALASVKKNNENVALFINKPRLAEKKFYLFNRIPFFSSNGEMFLPFLGIRLYPFTSIKKLSTLSSSAQEIFVLLFYLVKHMEDDRLNNNIFYNSPIHIYENQLMFTGGQEFIDHFEKYISIRNRVTLSRALNELEAQSIISSRGTTKSKKYFITESSYSLLLTNKNILKTPLYAQKFFVTKELILSLQNSFDRKILINPVTVGYTALSYFSMLSSPNYSEIALYKKENTLLKNILDDNLDNDLELSAYNTQYVLQFSKYDLNRFNKLYRDVIDHSYPEEIVDPLNLFLSLMNETDERVIDNINNLIKSKLR
ncbi:hypothetical protein OIS37_16090 [Lactiplantibacillus plantarum]|uniref:hypothetical protein n=1 Tax=Lactiplantibacillus plantarum TaxID=1590 RepID=UPI0021F6FE67|nr:hypothetical protein [Lactiplantibacillus plantarum]MCW0154646.1 hypothetical protein [Lactiplantibacillus plantarum]